MSNENTILDNLDKLSPDAMVIANNDVNQKHGKVVFTNMVKQAEQACSGLVMPEVRRNCYEDTMRGFEEEILSMRHACGEDVLTKKGKYKYSKVSHNSSYRSNKSVIAGALGEGVDLTEDGEPVPKSKLEKRVKEARSTTITPPTAYERAMSYVAKIKNVAGELSYDERHDIIDSLATIAED